LICAVCTRETRGFGWFDAGYRVGDPRRGASQRWFCSMTCQDICHGRRGMIDPTKHEIAAMQAASPVAGEYIESIGKTDMAAFTVEEWMTLIEVIVTAYGDQLRELTDSGEPPF